MPVNLVSSGVFGTLEIGIATTTEDHEIDEDGGNDGPIEGETGDTLNLVCPFLSAFELLDSLWYRESSVRIP
jgi:hypothetical protein